MPEGLKQELHERMVAEEALLPLLQTSQLLRAAQDFCQSQLQINRKES